MGLFDFFKKRGGNNPLADTMSQLNKQILPGGQAELKKVLDDLESMTNHECPREVLQRIFLYQSTLFTVSNDKSKSRIVGGTMRHKAFTVSSRVANVVYDYVLQRFAIQNYGIADETLLKMLNASFGNVEMCCTGDVINGASGPYGRCASNPIPVRGVPMQDDYLSHLRTLSGEKVTWKRLGSGHSDVTEHPIDMYIMYAPSGAEVGKVYVSGYQAITSKTAPEGFSYEEDKIHFDIRR